ncbi:MAG TPA: DUF429 domain-containing protein [Candidatus Melainabacteria bacterium]|jgi:hypothetical protein|nr:DUF429 domain-containing protein [Candidatus Melainabacteria bacterium]HIN64345.1 DUF429 domain-containing protein [Candidatus Obscuribacterales bacterium]
MAERLFYGVDYSGASAVPNNTWLATGRMGTLGLEIIDVRKVGSLGLKDELIKHKAVAVGIDSPFSLPVEFLHYMARKEQRTPYQTFQEMAEALFHLGQTGFIELAKEFKREPKRVTDKWKGSLAISPLHRGNPSMVQMTYQCIQLLAMLPADRFYTLPFQFEIEDACAVIEVYPRDTLRFFQLKESGYKSKDKKDEPQVTSVRHEIIHSLLEIKEKRGLTYRNVPKLSMNKNMITSVINSDHALDAVIACYTTAMFVEAKEFFTDPFSLDDLDVLLEGWIYRPMQAS